MARKAAKKPDSSEEKSVVSAIRHADKRANIPTEELRDFIDEEEAEQKIIRYTRDTSLDPQLVWKGKDEQDSRDLEVPLLPIYIQEKIHPKVIIEDFLAHYKPGGVKEKQDSYQADLFADFNGLPEEFDQRVDFYHHEQNWSNRLILGDSLQVMTSLSEKEGLKGKVQMIYIDPPYGIKFNSNWQVSTRKREVKDGRTESTTRQPEQIRAFRDTWKLGIHSYLAYLRDRLVIIHELLTDSGSVFVQIGNENLHLVKCLLDEVFGNENFCSIISFRKTTTQSGDFLPDTNDYIIWYAKKRENIKFHELYQSREGTEWVNYDYIMFENHDHRKLSKEEKTNPSKIIQKGVIYRRSPLTSDSSSETTLMPVVFKGSTYIPGKGGWKTNEIGFTRLIKADRIEEYGSTLSYRRYVTDFPYFPLNNAWIDTASGGYSEDKIYVVQTNRKIIERCLLMTTDPGDIILDPTCGSGTSAHVAEEWGRRWITIDTSRVALALSRTRLMSSKYPYYFLTDSPEGIAKESELTQQKPPAYPTNYDIRKGFVYKRVPHITLKSIANNEEIEVIWEKYIEKMESLHTSINKIANIQWKEWEIPRQAPGNEKLIEMLNQWWLLRLQCQKEVDASISSRAEMENLYDDPYLDPKRVRVTGPFTVESLSPHRILPADDNMDGTIREEEAKDQQDFASMILENIRVAGIQNNIKDERIRFATLDSYPGKWIHAQGTFSDAEGKVKKVALSIGPEHGTVGPYQMKEAAKESVQGVGFDLLIVCGFAFDPHIGIEMTRYGKLTVLPCRMNPDLSMGDELLKKTGAANLFVIYGEPDIKIIPQKSGDLVVQIRGVDVYDPTTGELRSNKTDDIACWFIDTDYDEESFFVRHSYFTGDKTKEPYEKLKRALKAEVDEDAWVNLYRTVSLPFPKPATGKIAVKVINHYGDEVMKVYSV